MHPAQENPRETKINLQVFLDSKFNIANSLARKQPARKSKINNIVWVIFNYGFSIAFIFAAMTLISKVGPSSGISAYLFKLGGLIVSFFTSIILAVKVKNKVDDILGVKEILEEVDNDNNVHNLPRVGNVRPQSTKTFLLDSSKEWNMSLYVMKPEQEGDAPQVLCNTIPLTQNSNDNSNQQENHAEPGAEGRDAYKSHVLTRANNILPMLNASQQRSPDKQPVAQNSEIRHRSSRTNSILSSPHQ